MQIKSMTILLAFLLLVSTTFDSVIKQALAQEGTTSSSAAEETSDTKSSGNELTDLKRIVEEMQSTIREQQGIIEELQGEQQKKNNQEEKAEGQEKTEQDIELEKEIMKALGGSETAPTPPTVNTQPIQPQTSRASRAILQNAMNPSISVIGDFVGNVTDLSESRLREAGEEDAQFVNRFSLRETEIGLQSVIDPYARADFFITVPDLESVDVEEGYITALSLPWNLQVKGGKFRANFGRLNRVHGPELPQIDRPNVITNFFGEEGLAVVGVNVSSLIPNAWDLFIEASFEVFNGESQELFAGAESEKPAYLFHLKNFFDLTDNSSFDLGFTGLTGVSDTEGKSRTTVEGIDLTLTWKPLQFSKYKSFRWQTEFLFNQKDTDEGNVNSFGLYSYAEYQLSQRWYVGGRYDYSEFPESNDEKEQAASAYFSFWASEFHRLRFQYKFTDRNFDEHSNEMQVQWTFTLGAHKPHPF